MLQRLGCDDPDHSMLIMHAVCSTCSIAIVITNVMEQLSRRMFIKYELEDARNLINSFMVILFENSSQLVSFSPCDRSGMVRFFHQNGDQR